jgi:lipopolysaccharide transport system permease protein
MSSWFFVFTQWLKRELAGRYRGSWFGLAWPLLQPLAQVAVFTLIFHGFMQLRWSHAELGVGGGTVNGVDPRWLYALNVWAGLAVFNFFAEILGRGPVAVLSQPNLVTKVKFPLLILPMVTVSSALVHIMVGAVVLWLASLLIGSASLHVLWLPMWLLPVLLYGSALACLLASLGIYVRDLVQATPPLTSLLMFLTPVFYPLAAVPESLRPLFLVNPLTWAAEALRDLLLLARPLDLSAWALHLGLSALALVIAYAVFQYLKTGFSDVL